MSDLIENLPSFDASNFSKEDWLINNKNYHANLFKCKEKNTIILSNGLVGRKFYISKNCATIGYLNHKTGEDLVRGIKPEAELVLNSKKYKVGGLQGQKEYGYLLYDWLEDLKYIPRSFRFSEFRLEDIKKRFDWKRERFHDEKRQWPPKGKELIMRYVPSNDCEDEIKKVIVIIHYECYDGIPLMSKWITIENRTNTSIRLNSYKNEILALVEFRNNSEDGFPNKDSYYNYPHLYLESDYSFGGEAESANHTTHWVEDPEYSSQVSYLSNSKIMMESFIEIGPEIDIFPIKDNEKKNIFEGFRDFQLMYSKTDRQRRGLARCQMYRVISPWITENPIMMHLTSFNPNFIKSAVEQMKEVGFEMLIISFGSNFNSEVLELNIQHPEWYQEMIEETKEEIIDPVHEKGLEIGGYSLLASRKISEKDDVVNLYTGKTSKINLPVLEDGIDAVQGVDESTTKIAGAPKFGNSPCLGSDWGKKYFKSLYQSIEDLQLDLLEHDGSYPGDICASTNHPAHQNFKDSQWKQWKIITNFYKWCKSRGIFLNVPDWYMLTGSNKTGIGYKEVNWSLPRDRQVILGRQNIYDGTWEKPPSMGWTFVPLTKYHTVPEYPVEVATLEPLSEHLDHYEAHLAQNFGSGVQACYRGFRLYDTDETKRILKKYVKWYKKYRAILDSDIIHIRRPDGRNIDGILHVNPYLDIKGLALFYNPTNQTKEEIIKIPLYYSGLKEEVKVSEKEEKSKIYNIERDYSIKLTIKISAKYFTWFIFE